MKKIFLLVLVFCAANVHAQTARALIGKDTVALRRDLNKKADSARNNAGILELRKNGVFVPQFTLPAGGGGGTLQATTDLGASTTNTVILRNQQLLKIPTIQGDTATTGPFGNYYHTLDQSYTNPDGQIDAVMKWGYNQNGAGGKLNPNEAAIHLAIESHYQPFAGAVAQFEFHIQSVAKNGMINRHLSINPSKINGETTSFMATDDFDFRSTAVRGNNPYFTANYVGQTSIQGLQSRLNIKNTTAATSGNLLIIPFVSGEVSFENTGNGGMFFKTGNLDYTFSDPYDAIHGGPVFSINRYGGSTLNSSFLKVKNHNNTGESFILDRGTQGGSFSSGVYSDANFSGQGAINNSYAGEINIGGTGDIFNVSNFPGGVKTSRLKINSAGQMLISTTPEYADNAAAIAAGLPLKTVYRTGDILKIVR